MNLTILHIGIKEWPYSSAFLEGKNRGGGVGKYADMLINGYPDSIQTVIITRRLLGQQAFEKLNNIWVYRFKTIPGRKARILSLGFISFFQALIIIKKHKIDIIQTHIFFNNLIGLLLKIITKIPVIAVPHSALYHKYTPEFRDLRRKIERNLERWLYGKLDKIIVFSHDHIEKYSLLSRSQPNNFHVIYTGIQFKSIPKPSFNPGRKLKFLFVGRLEKRKALDNVIEAFHRLEGILMEKLEFNIVGEGSESEHLKKLVDKYKLNDFVKFHGYVNNPVNFYRDSDVFLLVTNTEGLSLALLEAMANWNMCIVNSFGVPFNKNSVKILNNNHPETLKNVLVEVLNHPEEIKTYAENGFYEILNNFTLVKMVKNYVNLYESLAIWDSQDNQENSKVI